MERTAATYLVNHCIERDRVNACVVCDDSTKSIIPFFLEALRDAEKRIDLVEIPVAEKHGIEPNEAAAAKMLASDVILCITRYSLAHTDVRRRAEKQGIAFLSMPGYDLAIMNNPALCADYAHTLPMVQAYSDLLTKGNRIKVVSEKGTEVYLNIRGRQGNCCPGATSKTYLLGSPPDIEANISPIETDTEGVLVVDGSVADHRIGLLASPVVLRVQGGTVTSIESEDKSIESAIREIFSQAASEKAYVVGEFGIGFNDRASLCGNMLVDEGTSGCVHFGIGSNWTVGGTNKVDFHLDFVIRYATVTIDETVVIRKGELLYG